MKKIFVLTILIFHSLAQATDFTIKVESSDKKWVLKYNGIKVGVESKWKNLTSYYRHIQTNGFIQLDPATRKPMSNVQLFYESSNCSGTPYMTYVSTPFLISNNNIMFAPVYPYEETNSLNPGSRKQWDSPDCEIFTDPITESSVFKMRPCPECDITNNSILDIVEE